MPQLHVENVTLTFGGLNALTDVSLTVPEGEIVSIIGPNGAGKTSLLNCVSGFYHPTRGQIRFGEHDLTHAAPNVITGYGVARAFQNLELFRGLSVTENLLLAANEFREFLTFYPTHPRADYAQLQLARSYVAQMLAPERDQAATRDAIKEIEIFLQRFPNSKLMPEARKMERDARDRLSEANYRVGTSTTGSSGTRARSIASRTCSRRIRTARSPTGASR